MKTKVNTKIKPCSVCRREPDLQGHGECDIANPSWRVFCDECLKCSRGHTAIKAIENWNKANDR